MFVLAAAHAATVDLRLGYGPFAAGESQVGGTGYTSSFTFLGGEAGVGLRVNDTLQFGATGAAAAFGGYSVGGLAEWAPRGWTRISPLVGARLSASYEHAGCDVADGCPRIIDWPVLDAWGPMLQVRPGVRFGLGRRGVGLSVSAEGRVAARLPDVPAAQGLYVGGLIGLVVGLDVPVAGGSAP